MTPAVTLLPLLLLGALAQQEAQQEESEQKPEWTYSGKPTLGGCGAPCHPHREEGSTCPFPRGTAKPGISRAARPATHDGVPFLGWGLPVAGSTSWGV